MNKIQIVNNTGDSNDTKIMIDGAELQGVAAVEISIDPMALVKVRLTMFASEVDIVGDLDYLEIEDKSSTPRGDTMKYTADRSYGMPECHK